MDSQTAIRITGLTKSFEDNIAVDDLHLEVRRGELFGLVGPDGAGKTTIMRLLTAVMPPDSGEALVAGYSILREGERIKERIGYMSQRFGLYEDLTVMENIIFYADLYEVPKKERPARIERLLGFSNLTPFKERLAGKLSGGMKQKLGLACALIHTPEVLFLDEPTNGVDPVSRRDFWRILYDLLKEQVTIFVSTAYLDEAERCKRIGLINKGRLIMTDNPAVIKRSVPLDMVEIWAPDARKAAEAARGMAGVKEASAYGNRFHVALAEGGSADAVVAGLKEKGIAVIDHRSVLPSLEDIFISIVRSSG
ncbi:MAG TPA: ABC transporter ATP-binding protein [Syntrophorhabdaceae bacterium]|nr:ABC transporter ATP-binding protein [Syntrophorhabdaceae bacterium]HQM80479.1 ABC transporter ATP-binding protein [Syntrophorhabdaceae bacterium]